MLILAALQAFILVLILLAVDVGPRLRRSIYHDRLPVRAALAAFSAFVAYELFAAGLLTIFIRRGRNFPVLGRYVNAFVETSFPTVLLYLLAGYLSAPAIFGAWTALSIFSSSFSRRCGSILRFRPSPARSPQSSFSPLPSFILHLGWRTEDPDFSIGYHLTRSAVLLAAGSVGRLCWSDDQEPFSARSRCGVGSRRSDQPLRSTRLAASGRAAARNRRGRAQRNEAGLRHVR